MASSEVSEVNEVFTTYNPSEDEDGVGTGGGGGGGTGRRGSGPLDHCSPLMGVPPGAVECEEVIYGEELIVATVGGGGGDENLSGGGGNPRTTSSSSSTGPVSLDIEEEEEEEEEEDEEDETLEDDGDFDADEGGLYGSATPTHSFSLLSSPPASRVTTLLHQRPRIKNSQKIGGSGGGSSNGVLTSTTSPGTATTSRIRHLVASSPLGTSRSLSQIKSSPTSSLPSPFYSHKSPLSSSSNLRPPLGLTTTPSASSRRKSDPSSAFAGKSVIGGSLLNPLSSSSPPPSSVTPSSAAAVTSLPLGSGGVTAGWQQKQVSIKTLEGEFSVTMWASGTEEGKKKPPYSILDFFKF